VTYFGEDEVTIVKDVILPIEDALIGDTPSSHYKRSRTLLESLVEHCSKDARSAVAVQPSAAAGRGRSS